MHKGSKKLSHILIEHIAYLLCICALLTSCRGEEMAGVVQPTFPEHITLISKKPMQGLNFAVLCTLHGYILVSIDNHVLTRIISKTAKSARITCAFKYLPPASLCIPGI